MGQITANIRGIVHRWIQAPNLAQALYRGHFSNWLDWPLENLRWRPFSKMAAIPVPENTVMVIESDLLVVFRWSWTRFLHFQWWQSWLLAYKEFPTLSSAIYYTFKVVEYRPTRWMREIFVDQPGFQLRLHVSPSVIFLMISNYWQWLMTSDV